MKWPLSIFRGRRSGAVVPATQECGLVMFDDAFKSDNQWYQKALDIDGRRASDVSANTAVNACVNILSQEVAGLAINHWKVNPKTRARELQEDSPAARLLRKPNDYQTRSDFWLYEIRNLLFTGNFMALAERNARQEVAQLHPTPARNCQPYINESTGDIFYRPGQFESGLFSVSELVHSTNVLHVRINCNRHPLVGETPIAAVNFAGLTGNAIQQQVARFFANLARPSGVLMTPKSLVKKQIDELRDQFEAVSTGVNIGRIPVLHSDLKWEAVTMSAQDAETIKAYELTIADIAMAYRVPLFMLGDMSKATFRNVETLMRLFYTSALRFYLEHIENALNALFEFDGEREYVEFDIESGLLRGDLRERIESYTKAVQGGLMTPNEARARESLPPVDGGDSLFLQRQMVPIDKINDIIINESKNALATAAASSDPVPTAIAEAMDWERSKTYPKGSIALHRGGMWQATCTTTEEPGANNGEEPGAWRSLVAGVASTQVIDTAQPRHKQLLVRLSSGQIITQDLHLPLPLHLGTWDAERTYEVADEVAWQKCTWRATAPSQSSEPGKSGDWQLVAAGRKGERGERGAPGPRGEPGRQGDKGESAGRFVGAYEHGMQLAVGDVVAHGSGLWMLMRATELPPSDRDACWQMVYAMSQRGA